MSQSSSSTPYGKVLAKLKEMDDACRGAGDLESSFTIGACIQQVEWLEQSETAPPTDVDEYTSRPGVELFTVKADEGDESLVLENSLSNGLRIEIKNDDLDDIACFHIDSPEVAKAIAEKLLEMAGRMADPPRVL
jgi:hypothetical protein